MAGKQSKGGHTQSTAPTGWAFIGRPPHEGVTVRWKLGDPVAYVLRGKKIGDDSMNNILATIPVLPAGWTDSAEIRAVWARWAREQGQGTCG
jgi:hypothetical protein